MCVDDDEVMLRQMMSLCGSIGRIDEIKGFSDPAGALGYIRANSADIAFLDINMPGMNGLTLASEIRQISPDTAVVFITEHPEYALEAFRLHASGASPLAAYECSYRCADLRGF